MRSCTLMLAICVLVPCAVHAQQSWERNYGGTERDYGYSVQQTSDGGYIVVGSTRSFGDSDQVYLVKTSAFGDTLWTRTYGGASLEEGRSVEQTSDGGYVIAGITYSSGVGGDVFLVRTNGSGDTLWTRSFGGAGNDACWSVRQTLDGGYILAGGTTSFGSLQQAYLVKTNASGDTLWTRAIGGAGVEFGNSVEQTKDSGYIIAGWSSSSGVSFDAYLVKTDAAGETLWTRTCGGAGTGDDHWCSVRQTQDGGYIVGGYTGCFGDSIQVYHGKTTSSGDTMWTRTYGGARDDYGFSVDQAQDGGYVVAGYTTSYGAGQQDVLIIKTNASGDTAWTRTYGGTASDLGNSVQQTSDMGYIVAGQSTSFAGLGQVYLIKTDANGNIGIEETPSADVRTRNAGPTIVRGVFNLQSAISNLQSEIVLLDISGRKVLDLRPGPNDVSRLSPGVYFVWEQPKLNHHAQSVRAAVIIR